MEFLTKVDPIALTALTFVVISIVELIKRLYRKDFESVVIIAVSGIVGAIFAPYAGNISWFSGLLIGFSASGLITTATRLGGSK